MNVLMNSSSHGSEKETAKADSRSGNTAAVIAPVIERLAPVLRRTKSAKTGPEAAAAIQPSAMPRNQQNARNRVAFFRHQIATLEADVVFCIISLREQGVQMRSVNVT